MEMEWTAFWRFTVLEFHNLLLVCVWEVGEAVALAVLDHPGRLLARHSASKSETLSRLCHVNRGELGTPHAACHPAGIVGL